MIADPCCPILELNALRQVTGDTIRHGGLTLTERALAVCGLPAGARALDVGRGIGGTVKYLAVPRRFSAGGCDLSAHLLREGRRCVPMLPLAQALAECLPVANDSMDVILAECTTNLRDRG